MITYGKRSSLNELEVTELFQSSGINRPIGQPSRIKEMILNSDFIYTAWENEKLVGIARCVTDFSYCCYLSDLAVHRDYQNKKVGKTLIEYVEKEIGDEVTLVLLASESAMDYYPKIGFDKAENAYIKKRKY